MKKRIVIALVSIPVLLVLSALIVVAWAWLRTPALLTRITDSNEMTLRVDDVPTEWIEMLIEVEDPRFLEHHGVDVRTPGAGLTTITQGLAKEIYFEEFRPGLGAKLVQTLSAIALNLRIDKTAQLNLLLNRVYLGTIDGTEVHGFVDGAATYFGKPFSDLTEEEFLSLVAMIIGPNAYNPETNPAELADRTRRIRRLLNGSCNPRDLMDVYYVNCTD